MMQYKFQILTTVGLVESILESNSDFSCAPFGYVPYRKISSCDCDQSIIDDFWNCVDYVLKDHNLTEINYIRAVRAYTNNNVFGEIV